MSKPMVYLETSFFRYPMAYPSQEEPKCSRQKLTRDWWQEYRHKYDIYISNTVFIEFCEMAAGRIPDQEHRTNRISVRVESGVKVVLTYRHLSQSFDRIPLPTAMPSTVPSMFLSSAWIVLQTKERPAENEHHAIEKQLHKISAAAVSAALLARLWSHGESATQTGSSGTG